MRGDLRCIRRHEGGREVLYGLSTDIGERPNLVVAQPDSFVSMRCGLLDWLGRGHARILMSKPGGPGRWQPTLE
jgi:hypothetical protein